MPINVGISQLPGRTFGVMQKMTDVQAGLNLRAAIFELKRDYGEVVTVNEADRTRPVQLELRADYLRFLAGGPWAPLAAYCTAGPPAYFTSTHDSINYGNAADLGGPGGAVISRNARELLDGNHPRGVLGRKYGLYNTGWFFSPREIWHFNIYTSRAKVLATLADSIAPTAPKPDPAPVPEEDDDMKIIWADDHKSALLIAGRARLTVDENSPKLGSSQLDGIAQAKLFETACRVDVHKAWSGDAMTKSDNNHLALLLGRLQEG